MPTERAYSRFKFERIGGAIGRLRQDCHPVGLSVSSPTIQRRYRGTARAQARQELLGEVPEVRWKELKYGFAEKVDQAGNAARSRDRRLINLADLFLLSGHPSPIVDGCTNRPKRHVSLSQMERDLLRLEKILTPKEEAEIESCYHELCGLGLLSA